MHVGLLCLHALAWSSYLSKSVDGARGNCAKRKEPRVPAGTHDDTVIRFLTLYYTYNVVLLILLYLYDKI